VVFKTAVGADVVVLQPTANEGALAFPSVRRLVNGRILRPRRQKEYSPFWYVEDSARLATDTIVILASSRPTSDPVKYLGFAAFIAIYPRSFDAPTRPKVEFTKSVRLCGLSVLSDRSQHGAIPL
jgi:hypothetical protein